MKFFCGLGNCYDHPFLRFSNFLPDVLVSFTLFLKAFIVIFKFSNMSSMLAARMPPTIHPTSYSMSREIFPCTGYRPVHVNFYASKVEIVLNEKITLGKVIELHDPQHVKVSRLQASSSTRCFSFK